MKVLQINSVCGIRSTGRICTDLAAVLAENGHSSIIAFGREQAPEAFKDISFRIGSDQDVKLHALASRFFDSSGFHSRKATKKLLAYIDEYAPDVIHLHNVHGYYLNVPMLFDYIKKKGIPTVWTLHDCWAFTGHCSHYAAIRCDKWQSGCNHCPQKNEYPKSILADRSKSNYVKKKACFTNVPNLTIATPSRWLADETKKSFLGDYRIEVIPNGIDTNTFHPTQSNFRDRYNLEGKTIILGVATAWGEKKGLHRFLELAKFLNDQFQIVLVGLEESQLNELPQNVIGICKTNSAKELAEIYTAADICLSLSFEETMGLTVVEANACGTPAIVLDKTALPELITGQNGMVLDTYDAPQIAAVLQKANLLSKFSAKDCIKEAMKYEKNLQYEKYIEIYKELIV